MNALNGNALKTDQNGAIIAAPSGTLDLNAVHGALETLIELVPDITDAQMPQVAPVLMPQMYKIFIDPANYSIGLRKRAVQIFAALVEEIAEMCEYDKVNKANKNNNFLKNSVNTIKNYRARVKNTYFRMLVITSLP